MWQWNRSEKPAVGNTGIDNGTCWVYFVWCKSSLARGDNSFWFWAILSYVSKQSEAQEDGFWHNYSFGICDVVSYLSRKAHPGNLANIFKLTKGIKK